jgi:hypothetical protein
MGGWHRQRSRWQLDDLDRLHVIHVTGSKVRTGNTLLIPNTTDIWI